jgi:hypothetical protein
MKTLFMLMTIAVFFTACSNAPHEPSTANPANTNPVSINTTSPDAKLEPSETVSKPVPADAPVQFIYSGITPDKENFAYKIKVNTDKPITQVDITFKAYDEKGKVTDDTTVIWQNIVKSTIQPIEQGKVYDATAYLEPGSTKVDASLNRVVFKDGSTWSAK